MRCGNAAAGHASRLDHAGTAQIAVATLPALGDSSVEEVAVALFEQWGLGHSKDRSDGVLIVYVPGPPGQRKTRVEVGYGLEGLLPDGRTGALIREHSSPLVRENKFGEAAVALATAIAGVIEADAAAGGEVTPTVDSPRGGKGIGMPGRDDPREADTGTGAWPVVSVSMGVLFAWLLATYYRSRLPGTVHRVGALGLGGASVLAIATAGGIGGILLFVVGLVANGIAWKAIARHRCAKCGGWADDTREVLAEPTLDATGFARVTRRCTSCHDVSVTEQILPRKEAPTASSSDSSDSSLSSGDSGGGDFSGGGGGESGGGGASSSD